MEKQQDAFLKDQQKKLNDFWEDVCSTEKQKEMILNERRWSFWLGVKRDAMIEAGFTREEAHALLCSYLNKTEPYLSLNVRGVGIIPTDGDE